ncbi:MAG: hypothetical protein L3J37_02410 [Rhodobacteraceae bacterium]|nr:hypothetical protein [Paracoccaceae bacterium]
MIRFILALGLLASPAIAQDSAETLAKKMRTGTPMTAADFRAMAEGNTITYNNRGDDIYREYYRPDTNRVVIEWTTPSADGQINCDVGTWRAEEEMICFDWTRSGSVCSVWVDFQGEYISELVVDGQRRGNIEVISDISQTPLYCELGLVTIMPVPDITG